MTDEAAEQTLREALVSRRSGIITDLSAPPRGPEEPCPPYIYNATLAHFTLDAAPLSMRINGGKGRTDAEARLSAMGEAMERYSALTWTHQTLRTGLMSENAISPTDCVLYAEEQYAAGRPYTKWSPDVPISWVSGVDLATGAPTELPASLVFLMGAPPSRNDNLAPVSSNGLSAGSDLDQAILGGLYEVIERDALMITWLNKLPAIEIDTPNGGCFATRIIRHYALHGVQVRLLKLPTDQAATVIMAIADAGPHSGVRRVVGLGCDLDPLVAIDKAAFELCQLRPGVASRAQARADLSQLRSYAAVKTLDDHALFHTLPENAAEMDFLFSAGTSCSVQDMARPPEQTVAQKIDRIVADLTAAGSRVAYVDITAPDLASLAIKVVRVVATDFQPIHFGYGEGRFVSERLCSAPVKWGLRETALRLKDLNPCPHPLA